jgi:hypothetical protein
MLAALPFAVCLYRVARAETVFAVPQLLSDCHRMEEIQAGRCWASQAGLIAVACSDGALPPVRSDGCGTRGYGARGSLPRWGGGPSHGHYP